MIKDIKVVVLVVMPIILLLGSGCQSNQVRFIYVETSYFYDSKIYLIGDTVRCMNEAMFHKQLIRKLGRDKYYEIITKAKQDTNFEIPVIKEDYYAKENRIKKIDVFGTPQAKINYKDKFFKLTGDIEFLNMLKRLRNKGIVFLYPLYAYPLYMPSVFYRVGNLPKNLKLAFDSLGKDEFMCLYESRLDSILNMPIKYRKKLKGKIYDSRINPIKY